MRRIFQLAIFVCTAAAAPVAEAGPWGALPDAVARLLANPRERSAQVVVEEAEASILREATNGHLAAVAVLMETYGSLVVQLGDGEQRLQRQEARTAAALVRWGDGRRASALTAAATAWTLAARFDSTGAAVERLPYPNSNTGWRSGSRGDRNADTYPLSISNCNSSRCS